MYLQLLCCQVSSYGGCCPLCSAAHGDPIGPFAYTATMQQHASSVVSPVTWNGLPLEVHCLPRVLPSPFYGFLKTDFFRLAWVRSRFCLIDLYIKLILHQEMLLPEQICLASFFGVWQSSDLHQVSIKAELYMKWPNTIELCSCNFNLN